MTLLEAIAALVILALVGIGCLELAHGAAQLQTSSVAWDAAISQAESRMASVIAGAPVARAQGLSSASSHSPLEDGTVVTRTPWRNGLDQVAVTVAIDSGRSFTLRRLVPSGATSR